MAAFGAAGLAAGGVWEGVWVCGDDAAALCAATGFEYTGGHAEARQITARIVARVIFQSRRGGRAHLFYAEFCAASRASGLKPIFENAAFNRR